MVKGLSGLGAIACLSVSLGGLLSDVFNWRAALLTLAPYGGTALVPVTHLETAAARVDWVLDPSSIGIW